MLIRLWPYIGVLNRVLLKCVDVSEELLSTPLWWEKFLRVTSASTSVHYPEEGDSAFLRNVEVLMTVCAEPQKKITCFRWGSPLASCHRPSDTVRMNEFKSRTGILVNKTNRCTEFQFYWYYDSTCFGQFFCPSSGVLSRTSAKNSWWWAERLPETCRVVIPIKLELSASVGFIHR